MPGSESSKLAAALVDSGRKLQREHEAEEFLEARGAAVRTGSHSSHMSKTSHYERNRSTTSSRMSTGGHSTKSQTFDAAALEEAGRRLLRAQEAAELAEASNKVFMKNSRYRALKERRMRARWWPDPDDAEPWASSPYSCAGSRGDSVVRTPSSVTFGGFDASCTLQMSRVPDREEWVSSRLQGSEATGSRPPCLLLQSGRFGSLGGHAINLLPNPEASDHAIIRLPSPGASNAAASVSAPISPAKSFLPSGQNASSSTDVAANSHDAVGTLANNRLNSCAAATSSTGLERADVSTHHRSSNPAADASSFSQAPTEDELNSLSANGSSASHVPTHSEPNIHTRDASSSRQNPGSPLTNHAAERCTGNASSAISRPDKAHPSDAAYRGTGAVTPVAQGLGGFQSTDTSKHYTGAAVSANAWRGNTLTSDALKTYNPGGFYNNMKSNMFNASDGNGGPSRQLTPEDPEFFRQVSSGADSFGMASVCESNCSESSSISDISAAPTPGGSFNSDYEDRMTSWNQRKNDKIRLKAEKKRLGLERGSSQRKLLSNNSSRSQSMSKSESSTIEGMLFKKGLPIRLIDVLGTGNFAKVYKGAMAMDSAMCPIHSVVAVKVINTRKGDLGPDGTIVPPKSLTREAETSQNQDHPNLIRVYCVSIDRLPYAMVLEFCSGGCLHQHISGSVYVTLEKFSWLQRMKAALDIAEGMAHLHSQQIIHRDLKSLNILLETVVNNVNDAVHAKVADFGLARYVSDEEQRATKMTCMIGSWYFMAPELFTSGGDNYDVKVDVYSFAIVLYEMLAGTFDFGQEVDNIAAFVRLTANGGRPVQEVIPDTSPEVLGSIMRESWDAKPEKRPHFADIVLLLRDNYKSMLSSYDG